MCHRSSMIWRVIVRRPALSAAALLVAFAASRLSAATLVHQFNLDSSLTDSLGTGVSLAAHPNTDTSNIDASGWTWTATASPGGGLILTTGSITDPLNYSLGFRVQFNEVTTGGGGGGSQYRKLVSFKGTADDNGLYFQSANLVFYPFGVNAAITYSENTFYDFVFSRSSSDDTIRVYVVEGDGTVTKVYEESDSGQDAVPVDTGGGQYQFMLFVDDTMTTTEWTSGGICKSVRVWNGPLSQDDAADALSDAATTSATAVSGTSATLNGTVSPKGVATTVTFEYGTTTAYGTEVTAAESPVNSATVATVSKAITGLAVDTVYHYRVKAVNVNGTAYGADRTFATATTISASGGSTSFTRGGAAVVVDSGLTIVGDTVTDIKVSITGNFFSGDALAYTGSLPGGVTASYNTTTGILTFTGTTTVADWQTLLRTVTFVPSTSSDDDRTISFTLGGAVPFDGNGHYYEYVASPNIIWSNAKTAAESRTLFGLQGYLATITSQAENDFIRVKLGADAWIGGSDATVEGVWRWVSGPESGTQFSTGSVSFGGQFVNFNAGEPNNCCGGEHYLEIYSTDGVGKWNDLGAATTLAGYVTEYGDMAGDPAVQITANKTIMILASSGGGPAVLDACPEDPNKTAPGVCGCGVADTDTDGDGSSDCNDACPNDATKLTAGLCGCGVSDKDSDGDGAADCVDRCPSDPLKISPGLFGCGVLEVDSDGDGVPDATDGCPQDPNKTEPGSMGCGVDEADRDGDGVPDSLDGCPDDPNKRNPGSLGCGVPESPDLQVTITLGDGSQDLSSMALHVDEEIRTRILVANIGNGGATNVWVTIPLPAGMEFVSIMIGLVQSGQVVPENILVESDRISFPVGDVPAGYQVAADMVLRAKTAGTITLTPQTISEEMPQPVIGNPVGAEVGDIYDRVVTTYTYPPLCGCIGVIPSLLTACVLGLMRRRR